MSTVLITPKSIIADCSRVTNLFPKETIFDPAHKKLFMSPDRDFIIGLVGTFNPHEVDTRETYQMFKDLLASALKELPKTKDWVISFTSKENELKFKKLFGKENQFLIVTTSYRLMLLWSDNQDCFCGALGGDYLGLGSGGSFAMGFALSQKPTAHFWHKIHELDSLTAPYFTEIPLHKLKPFVVKDQEHER